MATGNLKTLTSLQTYRPAKEAISELGVGWLWMDVLQADGSYASMKVDPFRVGGGGGGSVATADLFQQDHITNKDRFFYEQQGGEPITTQTIESIQLSSGSQPLRIGANVNAEINTDLLVGGNVQQNDLSQVIAVWDEYVRSALNPDSLNGKSLYQSDNFTDYVTLGTDWIYALRDLPTYSLGQSDSMFLGFEANKFFKPRNDGGGSYASGAFLNSPQFDSELVYRVRGESEWKKVQDYYTSYGRGYYLFRSPQKATYEFNIRIRRKTATEDVSEDFRIDSEMIEVSHYILKNEESDSFDVFTKDLNMNEPITHSGELFMTQTHSLFQGGIGGDLPLKLSGLKAGDKVLLRFGLYNYNRLKTGGDRGYLRGYLTYRKGSTGTFYNIGDLTTNKTYFFWDWQLNRSATQELSLAQAGGYYLFEIPASDETKSYPNGDGDYEFGFELNVHRQTLFHLTYAANKVPNSSQGVVLGERISVSTASSNVSFTSDPVSIDLNSGDTIQLLGSFSNTGGNDSAANLEDRYQLGLSYAFGEASESYFGLNGESDGFTPTAYPIPYKSGNFVEYFTASQAGTYKFRMGMKNGTASSVGGSLVVLPTSELGSIFQTKMRVLNQSSNTLKNETSFTLEFPNRNVLMNESATIDAYKEFISEEKFGSDFHIGESNSYNLIKGSDESYFSFEDAVIGTRLVYTTFQTFLNVLQNRLPRYRDTEIDFGREFPLFPKAGDTFVFTDNIAEGVVWRDSDRTTLKTSADRNDVARYSGFYWYKIGNLAPDVHATDLQVQIKQASFTRDYKKNEIFEYRGALFRVRQDVNLNDHFTNPTWNDQTYKTLIHTSATPSPVELITFLEAVNSIKLNSAKTGLTLGFASGQADQTLDLSEVIGTGGGSSGAHNLELGTGKVEDIGSVIFHEPNSFNSVVGHTLNEVLANIAIGSVTESYGSVDYTKPQGFARFSSFVTGYESVDGYFDANGKIIPLATSSSDTGVVDTGKVLKINTNLDNFKKYTAIEVEVAALATELPHPVVVRLSAFPSSGSGVWIVTDSQQGNSDFKRDIQIAFREQDGSSYILVAQNHIATRTNESQVWVPLISLIERRAPLASESQIPFADTFSNAQTENSLFQLRKEYTFKETKFAKVLFQGSDNALYARTAGFGFTAQGSIEGDGGLIQYIEADSSGMQVGLVVTKLAELFVSNTDGAAALYDVININGTKLYVGRLDVNNNGSRSFHVFKNSGLTESFTRADLDLLTTDSGDDKEFNLNFNKTSDPNDWLFKQDKTFQPDYYILTRHAHSYLEWTLLKDELGIEASGGGSFTAESDYQDILKTEIFDNSPATNRRFISLTNSGSALPIGTDGTPDTDTTLSNYMAVNIAVKKADLADSDFIEVEVSSHTSSYFTPTAKIKISELSETKKVFVVSPIASFKASIALFENQNQLGTASQTTHRISLTGESGTIYLGRVRIWKKVKLIPSES